MREISIRSLLLHSDGDRSGVDSVVGAVEGREIPAVVQELSSFVFSFSFLDKYISLPDVSYQIIIFTQP